MQQAPAAAEGSLHPLTATGAITAQGRPRRAPLAPAVGFSQALPLRPVRFSRLWRRHSLDA